jgi:hypothetical protein
MLPVVAIYGVLFMETKDEHNPFLGVSERFGQKSSQPSP